MQYYVWESSGYQWENFIHKPYHRIGIGGIVMIKITNEKQPKTVMEGCCCLPYFERVTQDCNIGQPVGPEFFSVSMRNHGQCFRKIAQHEFAFYHVIIIGCIQDIPFYLILKILTLGKYRFRIVDYFIKPLVLPKVMLNGLHVMRSAHPYNVIIFVPFPDELRKMVYTITLGDFNKRIYSPEDWPSYRSAVKMQKAIAENPVILTL